jgi:hypothetical protein
MLQHHPAILLSGFFISVLVVFGDWHQFFGHLRCELVLLFFSFSKKRITSLVLHTTMEPSGALWYFSQASWETSQAFWETSQALWETSQALWETSQALWETSQASWETSQASWETSQMKVLETICAACYNFPALKLHSGMPYKGGYSFFY